uniref:Uncharacterized protein n=1 Tax=Mustela putorius furo TaxID=9669 RepID=M3YBF5_MUSPF
MRPRAAPSSGPLGVASRAPTTRAKPAPLSHLRPRAVLESRAEVLGAPSALAGAIALHGPGGRSRVSEAWSPRAAGSHRRRGAGDTKGAGRPRAHGAHRGEGRAGLRGGRRARGGAGGAGGAERAEFRSQSGVRAAGGRSRPHSSCPGQVVSGCGFPGPAPPPGCPAASPAHPSQACRPLARSRPAQSPAPPPPLGEKGKSRPWPGRQALGLVWNLNS